MKIPLILTLLIAGYLHTDIAVANDDDMPEFCAAVLRANSSPEYKIWFELYDLDEALVNKYVGLILLSIDLEEITPDAVERAAYECELARLGE
jgi:hypothetical protein